MKWVHLGLAGIFMAAALAFDKQHRGAILAGAILAAAVMYGLYWHAERAGLMSDEPATEQPLVK
jgi:hypothetical protein